QSCLERDSGMYQYQVDYKNRQSAVPRHIAQKSFPQGRQSKGDRRESVQRGRRSASLEWRDPCEEYYAVDSRFKSCSPIPPNLLTKIVARSHFVIAGKANCMANCAL